MAAFEPFRRLKRPMNREGVLAHLGTAIENAIILEVDLMDVRPELVEAIANLHKELVAELGRTIDPKKPTYPKTDIDES